MTSPQYGYAPISGINYLDALNNQFLQAAMMAPNVNFKASQTSQIQDTNAAQSATDSGAIPVVNASETQQASAGGSNFVTTALATAVIGGGALWMLKSGKFSQAGKALKSLIGKGETKSSTVLTRLQAVKNGSGEIKLNVPNKTKTFAGTHIETNVQEYGIQSAISAERQVFNPKAQETALRGFQVNTPIGRYTVFTENGQIKKVLEGHKDVSAQFASAKAKTTDAELLEQFNKIAAELGKDSKEIDKNVLKDVVNISYINKYGDDELKLVMSKYGAKPELKAFRTLEQINKNDVAVMQYSASSSEKVLAGDLVQKTGWFNQKKVLADGAEVLRCEKEIAGAKCYFNGNKLEKIIIDGNPYTSESLGYDNFVKKNEQAIEQFKKDVFEDKIVSEIPIGAIIGSV